MDKEENKKVIKERHKGVLLEDVDSKLDILVGGQMALDVKIDRHYGEFRDFVSETNFKFAVVFEKFDEVNRKFEIVFGKFRDIDKQFGEFDDKFEVVFEELHELRKERVG